MFSCKSLSIDLTPPGALVNIYDGQKVTLKCIAQDAATQQNNDGDFVKIDANTGEVVTWVSIAVEIIWYYKL